MDYFQLNQKSYGILVDRFSNFPIIYHGDSAADVCQVLSRVSEDYGIPETVTTDGAQCYVAVKVKRMMETYGISHRINSVANPHANCRAELGVKTMKRLIRNNVTLNGDFSYPEFSRAILQYRNTRDRDTGYSPAEMLMGRQLRNFIPRSTQSLMGETWHIVAKQ